MKNRDKRIVVRIRDDEFLKIKSLAEAENLSISSFSRRALLGFSGDSNNFGHINQFLK